MFNISSAQIAFTLITTNPPCNSGSPGSVVVTVNPTNPPYSYQWDNGEIDSMETNSIVADLEIGEYTLTIMDGLSKDTNVFIRINGCSMVPEIVFTPNGDGYNDKWDIQNSEYFPNSLIMVFNRWGQKVYEHKGVYNPWNGKDLLGVPVPDASYFFIIFENKEDKKSLIKGNVSILK